MTIDHLRVDHRVTVIQDFTDARGVTLRTGETGILRGLGSDQIRLEIHIIIELPSRKVDLVFPQKATTGPRNGRMRDYFEIGEDVTPPRVLPAFHDPAKRQMIIPAPDKTPAPMNGTAWARRAQTTEGPDRLVDLEKEMLAAIDHIGVAASIAEIYAGRMRAFQRAGDEPRAIAAFKLAVDWMGSYAGSATSGGEGAALSYEYDRFHKALVFEFGYDPTDEGQSAKPWSRLP